MFRNNNNSNHHSIDEFSCSDLQESYDIEDSQTSEDPEEQSRYFAQYGDWAIEDRDQWVNLEGKIETINSVTYYYQSRIIGTIYFLLCETPNINLLHDVYFSEKYNILEFIHSNAPNSKLINYYVNAIQTNTFDKAIFKKHAANYFEGPLTDYLDHELDHGLIISNIPLNKSNLEEELFNKHLFPLLQNEGIAYSFLKYDLRKIEDIWLRDYNICMGNGVQYIHPDYVATEKSQDLANKILKLDRDNFHSRTWDVNFSLCAGGSSTTNDDSCIRARKLIREHCEHNNIQYMTENCILEGGNIFTTTKDNKTYVVVGEILRTYNAVYRQQMNATPLINLDNARKKFLEKKSENPKKYDDNHFYSKLNDANLKIDVAHIKEAKYAIAKILNIPFDRLIFLDNYEYHIDLYLSKGPNNIIFMHNDKLTAGIALQAYSMLKKSKKISGKEKEKLLSAIKDTFMLAVYLHQITGDILLRNKRKLESYGFTVIDVPGIAYRYNPEKDKNPNSENCQMTVNFMNGYSGKGKNGYFHITLSSRIKYLSDKFASILKENGVDNVYFIGSPDQAEEILANNGSLRCMSIPGSLLFGNFSTPISTNRTTMPKNIYLHQYTEEEQSSDETYTTDDTENDSLTNDTFDMDVITNTNNVVATNSTSTEIVMYNGHDSEIESEIEIEQPTSFFSFEKVPFYNHGNRNVLFHNEPQISHEFNCETSNSMQLDQ